MDCLFDLQEPELSTLLRFLTQSLSCTYICLWSHRSITSPFPSNHLICSGALFDEDQPTSSSLSLTSATTLFAAYQQLAVPLDSETVVWGCNGLRVPGFAFKNRSSRPCIELKDTQLLTYSFHQIQREFYQGAKIKTAVFLGCPKGEVELGSCNVISQVEVETGLKELFSSQGFSKVQPSGPSPSSSSSVRSTDSPESSLIFAIPGASHVQPEATPLRPPEPYQQALPMLPRSPLVPTLETEHNAMKSAFLAALSSPSSSTHSSQTPPQFLHHLFQQPPPKRVQMRRQQRPSAFGRFRSREQQLMITARSRQISMMKRSILYYRRLNVGRREYYGSSGGAPPTTTQLHHMMSERKRREKQNELFQALRSLLPPQTKKDKSAVLTTARNQMKLLQEQVRDLQKKNESLQAKLSLSSPSSSKQHTDHDHEDRSTMIMSSSTSRSEPRHEVVISEVAESTSDGSSRAIDLRIRVVGVECPMDALIIRLLELIRRDHGTVSLMSMEAHNMIMQSLPFTYITMRLQIQGRDDEGWDERSFEEAVRRVVADVAP